MATKTTDDKTKCKLPAGLISWEQVFDDAIETAYKEGCRDDKKVVCGWVALKAAKRVNKTRGGKSLYLKLVSVGYDAAIAAWGKYDAAKDTGTGREAYLFKSAEGRMRNYANESDNAFGMRKHSKDQVLPTAESLIEALGANGGYGRSGASATPRAERGTDLFFDAGAGGPGDKAVNQAADKAARSKATRFKPLDPNQSWTKKPKTPTQATGSRTTREAREAEQIHVAKLLAPLPKEDREVIISAYGIDGAESMSYAELADKRGGDATPAGVARWIKKIEQEIRESALAETPKLIANTKDNQTLFHNGAKIKAPLRINAAFQWQAWSQP